MSNAEFDRIVALTDDELLDEFSKFVEAPEDLPVFSDEVADFIIRTMADRGLFRKIVPRELTEAEKVSMERSIVILTSPLSELFERLFCTGLLGDQYDRAKAIHDEFGKVEAVRGDTLRREVIATLLIAGEGGPVALEKALDLLEEMLDEYKTRPFIVNRNLYLNRSDFEALRKCIIRG